MIETVERNTPPSLWKHAGLLWLFSFLAFFCVLPYAMALQGGAMDAAAEKAELSATAMLALGALQQAVMLAVFAVVGLGAARRLGLSAPLSEAWLTGRSLAAEVGAWWRPAIIWGVVAGVLILGLAEVFKPYMPSGFEALAAEMTWWQGLLASFYGGIAEEVMLRLFLLSVLALVLRSLFARGTEGLPDAVFWIANIVAAVIFGVGHLPAVMGQLEITAVVVTYAVLLNGILGVGCGVLFRRHGLECAMLAHFTADIVLHVMPPLFS